MISVFRIREYGDASQLKSKKDLELPPVKDYQILIKHVVMGVNRYDLEVMAGGCDTMTSNFLPLVPGVEIVGVVEAVGRGVANFSRGDRIACCTNGYGGLAEKSVVHMNKCVHIPDDITDEIAAAGYFKGATALTLLTRVFAAYPDAKIVVFGPTGGVGHMITQFARSGGCFVIGISNSQEQATLAMELGCNKVLILHDEEIEHKIIALTDDYGVNAVFDPIFNTNTLKIAEKVLGNFGMYVPYGRASGSNPKINLQRIADKSLYVTRPNMRSYSNSPLTIQAVAARTFELFNMGVMKPKIFDMFPFKSTAKAYKQLEGRELMFSSIIWI